MALTEKQKMFVKEYLIDLNATQAAIRAGYSEDTAKEIGYENLTKPHIQKVIQKAMDERSKRTEITADMVVKELAKIGFADIKDFLSFRTAQTVLGYKDGERVIDYAQIIELKDSDQVDGTLISEVSLSKDGTLKFKLHDKKGALELLGRHLKMFTDKTEVTGKNGGPIEHSINLSNVPQEEIEKELMKLEKLEQGGKGT